ncbi:hypothetical protein QVD17_19922 [Tagetes erecta]|uniref:Uncharacterized protein n=1 Tax=Tagetes erecta TaxID=13708 RepID=A0AAD8KKB5_TARER|nr:hypothetical protein QVD17_19922 [Tagetes erecta]
MKKGLSIRMSKLMMRIVRWGQHLENLGEKSEEIYVDAIIEWMSTMKKKPEAKFDTGALNRDPYEYPPDERIASRGTNDPYWHDMIRELFVVPPVQDIAKWPLRRENLKVLPKLLLIFLTQNILPRFWDYTRVRLLSKIFKKQKVLPKEAIKKKISHPTFIDWKFERNGEIYRLVDVKWHRYMEVGSGIGGVRFDDSRTEDARMRELAEREEQRRQVEIGDRTPYERMLMLSQELERTRLYRQYCISSYEYYRKKDFGFLEGVRNYHDEKDGLPYTERPVMPDRSASAYVPYSTSRQMPNFPQFTPFILFPPTPQFEIPQSTQAHDGQGSSISNQAEALFMGDLQRGLLEGIFGRPFPRSPLGGH